jgi:adenine-specific DNA-methyltransferase
MSTTNREVLEALRTAFPQLFTRREEDGQTVERIDLEKIRLLAGDGNYSDRFGLRWEDKPERFDAETVGKLPTLKHIPGKAVHQDPAKPTHVLIQGDNYHALKVLAYTHERLVDVIYIDPPYGTGKKDFKYNDRWVDKEDGYRHSKWLSFITKRLRLAKQLLRPDGVIFISIDDNEQAPLTLLCDEVFGAENRIGPFVKKIAGGKNDSKFIKVAHEYLLCYSATPGAADRLLGRNWITEKVASQSLRKWGDNDRRQDRPNLFFPVFVDEASGRIELSSFAGATEVLPKRPDGSDGCWRWSQKKIIEENARLIIKRKKSGTLDIHVVEDEGAQKVSPWDSVIEENTGPGGTALREILGDAAAFTYPKNPDFMQWVIARHPSKDAVILDFFAGSGTTAHAVMQLNADDGGSRQCILVTNDEGEFKDADGKVLPGGICTHVTYPRLKKVIEGYTTPKGKEAPGLGENLEFFETAFQAVPKSRRQLQAFVRHSTALLQLKAGCFTQVEATSEWSLHTDGAKHLFILFDDCAVDAAIERLRAVDGHVVAFVFAYDSDDDSAELLSQLPNVTVQEVPQPLLDLFFRIKE